MFARVGVGSPEESWRAWVFYAWIGLVQGKKLPVPASVAHPSAAGFRRLSIAEPAGQIADWAYSLPDGSRIHVHEYPGGRFVAHRDKIDPGRGVIPAARHFLAETRVGRAATVGGLVFGAAKLVARVGGFG